MPRGFKNRLSLALTLAFCAMAMSLPAMAAPQEKVIYTFTGGSDGGDPQGSLILDSNGNLYGTTELGGTSDTGTVFELVRLKNGTWSQRVLHSFAAPDTGDGEYPFSALLVDRKGDLLGTTYVGGSSIDSSGSVFELSPVGNSWNESNIFSFTIGSNGRFSGGSYVVSGLIADAKGSLYGTASAGGSTGCDYIGCGVVYQLASLEGGWHEKVLHIFFGPDGADPISRLVMDSAGRLYGTTPAGGNPGCIFNGRNGCGLVFELTPVTGGGWNYKVLYSFTGNADGANPASALIMDASGRLFGTTNGGGLGYGTIFELTNQPGGAWEVNTLHTFNLSDGSQPYGTLALDQEGRLYGTTAVGGVNNTGTVFELAETNGIWNETILHSFGQPGQGDGNNPLTGIIIGPAGNLYGTTALGGKYNQGTVFQIAP